MFRFLILSALVACAYGASFNHLALRGFEDRIFGGTPISITAAPYQVALLYDSAGTGSYSLRCGGSIYSTDTIVTSANCVSGTNPSRWRIRAGTGNYNSGGQLVDVYSYKIHEDYNSNTKDFDVAILKLTFFLGFDDLTVKAIPLKAADGVVQDNSIAVTSGWGSTYSGGSVVTQLHAVTISIINQNVCKTNYSDFKAISVNMICAGSSEPNTCLGDSGGPLVVNGELVGITSWGRGCAPMGYPGVFSRISTLKRWIDANGS